MVVGGEIPALGIQPSAFSHDDSDLAPVQKVSGLNAEC
jgi:hypothetical protein